jgi:dipeptidase D
LVQSSNNISIIKVEGGTYRIACHTRSSVDAEREELAHLLRDCFSFAKVAEIGPYPGWEPKPGSELLAIAKKCYTELNGVPPAIKSIHAGLECGILSGTFPHMEMISFGPNILGAHSPEERLQISSTQKFWKFLNKILQTIE